MNGNIMEQIEALYYETEIPDSVVIDAAREKFFDAVASRKDGKALSCEDTYELENENAKQGFVYGFQCAARMSELLKGVSA